MQRTSVQKMVGPLGWSWRSHSAFGQDVLLWMVGQNHAHTNTYAISPIAEACRISGKSLVSFKKRVLVA